jgi:penicillin-binding protein 2
MSWIRSTVPSMFQRRLAWLASGALAVMAVLGAQLARLTVLQGAQHRLEAERVLAARRLLPTVRGSILDAKGRVLAEDRACFDITVDYPVLTGQWAHDQAQAQARRDHRQEWARLSFDEREALIEQYRAPFDAQLQRVWWTIMELGGITEAELQQRRETIITRVQTIRADFWDRRAKRRALETGGEVELRQVVQPILEEQSDHAILRAVADETAIRFRKVADLLPGLHVEPSRSRSQPTSWMEVELKRDTVPTPMRDGATVKLRVESLGAHVIGALGQVGREDIEARPFHRSGAAPDLNGYLPGDLKGVGGVEQSEETRLRGSRGQLVIQKDTGVETRQPPVRGEDVRLTIDVALEARLRGLLDPEFGLMRVQPWHGNADTPLGTPLNGSVTILEVDTGAILAMVSTPVPPPRVAGRSDPDLSADPDHPMLNRVGSGAYPPGSTLKPIVYCIAAARRAVGWDQTIECRGHLLPDRNDIYRCWIFRERYGFQTHGPLPPHEAIARSCNIYFNTCGRNLGAEQLVADLGRWGFGRAAGIGLPGEIDGILPSLTGRNSPGRELSLSNAIQLGIGQGPIAVPPLQVAAAHAALARGGYYLAPTLLRHRAGAQEGHDLGIPPRVLENAQRGMYDSANQKHGTGHELPVESGREPILGFLRDHRGFILRAKTGTAQAPVQFEDRNGDGRRDEGEPILRAGDHSWYVCHVQRQGEDRARYVIVAMVEYGGSGGRVSGPLVNQVLYALQFEGYL